MAVGRPHEVLTKGEKISWAEFVSRLKTQLNIDINHYGVGIFNEQKLKFEPVVLSDGKNENWVSLKEGN